MTSIAIRKLWEKFYSQWALNNVLPTECCVRTCIIFFTGSRILLDPYLVTYTAHFSSAYRVQFPLIGFPDRTSVKLKRDLIMAFAPVKGTHLALMKFRTRCCCISLIVLPLWRQSAVEEEGGKNNKARVSSIVPPKLAGGIIAYGLNVTLKRNLADIRGN